MGSMKIYATLAGFLAVAASGTATFAADLLPPPPPMPEEPIASDIGGGWYLRGDVGVSRYGGGKVRTASAPDVEFYGNDFGSGAFAGAGVGYQFTSFFRMDVTGEYRFSKQFKLFDQSSFVSNGFPINGYEKTTGDFSSAVVLVNGYFDLGTWYGVTPFVGAGVGYAHHWTEGFDTSTLNVYTTLNTTGVSGGHIRDHSGGDLAWALYAGLGYDVTPNVKLELGYRYLNMGTVRTGVIDCYCGETYSGLKIKDVDSHEVKLGMRWMLGGPVAAPAFDAPLIRKY